MMRNRVKWAVGAAALALSSFAVNAEMTAEQAQLLSQMNDEAQQLRSALPVDVDEVTKWVDVEAGPGLNMHYIYEVDMPQSMNADAMRDLQKNMMVSELCADPEIMQDFENGITYNYHYEVAEGNDFEFTVNQNDCN